MPVEGGSEAVSVLSLPNSDDLLVFFFFDGSQRNC